jgi:TRAP-type mannitol/chloroaromatic compound transport system permease small subunit
LLAAVFSAVNAGIRYIFDRSSNGWLEIQWYMFAACVMLGAAVVLKLNEHVRVDVLYGGRSDRTKAVIDLFGLICLMLPSMLLLVYYSWPFAYKSFVSGEMSSNAGGLIRWPVYMLLPFGFGLLALQAISEIIKRAAFLSGDYKMDIHYERPVQ